MFRRRLRREQGIEELEILLDRLVKKFDRYKRRFDGSLLKDARFEIPGLKYDSDKRFENGWLLVTEYARWCLLFCDVRNTDCILCQGRN